MIKYEKHDLEQTGESQYSDEEKMYRHLFSLEYWNF